MRGKDLLEKLELADDNYISESAEYKKKDRGLILRIAAIAAALALVIAAVPVSVLIAKSGNNPTPGVVSDSLYGGDFDTAAVTNEIIDHTDAVFTASEIGRIFNIDNLEDAAATNAYVRIYVPSEDAIYCMPVPDGEKVNIYDIKSPDIKATEKGCREFGEKYLSKICQALGIKKPDIIIKERTDYEDGSFYYDMYESFNNRYVGFSELKYTDCFYFGTYREKIAFDGIDITVDQRQTDGEMMNSLQPLREKLCEAFGVDLPDIYIERRFNDYDENGCTHLSVYLYNSEKNGVDFNIFKCSDYIAINFDNLENYDGDIVSKTILQVGGVRYYHMRCAPEEICGLKCTADLVTLEEAEKLLYKGYVFGGHVCPLCMAMQAKIAFDEYDKVGLIYYNGIPFYAFYKILDQQNKNGTLTYARTLVPAVEVSGYEEYFESQKANHRSYSPDEVVE